MDTNDFISTAVTHNRRCFLAPCELLPVIVECIVPPFSLSNFILWGYAPCKTIRTLVLSSALLLYLFRSASTTLSFAQAFNQVVLSMSVFQTLYRTEECVRKDETFHHGCNQTSYCMTFSQFRGPSLLASTFALEVDL